MSGLTQSAVIKLILQYIGGHKIKGAGPKLVADGKEVIIKAKPLTSLIGKLQEIAGGLDIRDVFLQNPIASQIISAEQKLSDLKNTITNAVNLPSDIKNAITSVADGALSKVADLAAHTSILSGTDIPNAFNSIEGAIDAVTGAVTTAQATADAAQVAADVAATTANWSGIDDDNGHKPQDNATKNTPRGPWTDATVYEFGDLVSSGGSSYVCFNPHTSSGSFDPTKFYLLASSGTTGPTGLANGLVYIFKRSATSPALPTATTTYTFATGVLTGLDNGWTQALPTGTTSLWVSVATVSSNSATDTIAASEWSSPSILADNGINSASVFLYQRATSVPSVPSTTSTYTFSTGVLTGHDNGWSQSLPSGLDPLYMTSATAAGTGTTDTIATGEWAAVTLLAANGNYVDLKFIRSVSQPSTPTGDSPSGWSDSVPSGTDALWISSAPKNYSGVLIGVWSTPRRLTGTNPRGAYSSSTTYYEFDTVSYNGGTYIATQNNFSAQAPSGTAATTAYWDVIAAPGATGTPATPPSAFSANVNLTSGANVNLRTVADANGYTGASDATITFKVPNGVTIRGLSSGGKGIDTGTWPTSSYTIALTLIVESGGIVDGGGGAGATGGDPTGHQGSPGGDAIYVRLNMTGGITINSGGTVRGGGGGGGGGGGRFGHFGPIGEEEDHGNGGGGGGGGFPNGSGGVGGSMPDGDGSSGSVGTTSGGGSGGGGSTGSGTGGGGGAAASTGSTGGNGTTSGQYTGRSGGAGGAGGFAVRKNGNTVTVTNNGTMTGSAA
jgi:hypothetical protein